MRISSGLVPHASNLTDMDFQIHCTETEAYSAVLRAFIAQSDVLSWGKEGLITELRKELRVSDVEHREILGKINSDESIKSLRERRKSTQDQLLSFDPSMKHMPSKKLKVGNTKVPSSPNFPACAQPSAAVIPSSLAVRASTSTQVRDGKWCADGVLAPQMNVTQTVGPAPVNRRVPDAAKLKGSLIVQTTTRGPVHSGFASLKPGSNIIDIRATDKLLHEVRTVCQSENPNPAQVEKARFILREHERALMYAIGKLADVSDDSPDKNTHLCSNEEQQWNGCGHHRAVYKQFRRTEDWYNAFDNDLAVNAGKSFIADDEYNQAH